MSIFVKTVLGLAVAAAVAAIVILAMPTTEPPVPPVAPVRPVVGKLIDTEPRKPVPEVVFHDVDGQAHRLSDFTGKVVLVNFWATWCPPCVAEMPALDALQHQLDRDRFALVALSLDRGGIEVAHKWLDEHQLANITPYIADQAQARALNTMGQLPVSILIDAQGREVGRVLGAADWEAPAMVERIQALMRE